MTMRTGNCLSGEIKRRTNLENNYNNLLRQLPTFCVPIYLQRTV